MEKNCVPTHSINHPAYLMLWGPKLALRNFSINTGNMNIGNQKHRNQTHKSACDIKADIAMCVIKHCIYQRCLLDNSSACSCFLLPMCCAVYHCCNCLLVTDKMTALNYHWKHACCFSRLKTHIVIVTVIIIK